MAVRSDGMFASPFRLRIRATNSSEKASGSVPVTVSPGRCDSVIAALGCRLSAICQTVLGHHPSVILAVADSREPTAESNGRRPLCPRRPQHPGEQVLQVALNAPPGLHLDRFAQDELGGLRD